MTRSRIIFALLLASTAAAVHAEPYRCNVGGQVVYQETPCYLTAGRSGSEPPVAAAAPPPGAESPGPIEAGKQLCREQAPKHVAWKDPESVRVGGVYGGKMDVIDLGSVKTSGRQFFVEVNAKNSYGGYVGQKPLVCYTSQDGTRIIKVDGLLL